MFKNKKQQEKKPFTAGELMEYLQQFPKDAQIEVGIIQSRGKNRFAYPVTQFTLITDNGNPPAPTIMMKIGRAFPVETTADKIRRAQAESGAAGNAAIKG